MLALERRKSSGTDFELLCLATGAVLIIGAWTFPFWNHYYPFECPMKAILGIPCAFCGGTRSAFAWSHGHFHEAWIMNPLVAVGAGLATLYLPYAAFCVATHQNRRLRLTGFSEAAPSSFRWGIRLTVLAAVLLNWGYLIHAGR